MIKNNTQWPIQVSLNNVGPLYWTNPPIQLQPGQTWVKDTGPVAWWFTVRAELFLPRSKPITEIDAVLPVASLVASALLT